MHIAENKSSEKYLSQVLNVWLSVCFEIILEKTQVIFSKAMFDLRVGWTHFHKITPTNLKRVFCC
jgi:hypothetical protein